MGLRLPIQSSDCHILCDAIVGRGRGDVTRYGLAVLVGEAMRFRDAIIGVRQAALRRDAFAAGRADAAVAVQGAGGAVEATPSACRSCAA